MIPLNHRCTTLWRLADMVEIQNSHPRNAGKDYRIVCAQGRPFPRRLQPTPTHLNSQRPMGVGRSFSRRMADSRTRSHTRGTPTYKQGESAPHAAQRGVRYRYVGGGGGRMVDGFVTHAPHRGNATVLSANNLSHSERVREGVIKYDTQLPDDPVPGGFWALLPALVP